MCAWVSRLRGKSYLRVFKDFEDVSINMFLFFNWDSLHARLNSHYEAWMKLQEKKSTKRLRHTRNLFRKNLQLKDVW